jgi:hypothetical protein
MILKLKIFAARQKEDKEKTMFCDLIARFPEKGCKFAACFFNCVRLQELVRLYANEWTCDGKKNKDHFRHLIDIVESHHCESHFDLAFAQGIDVNALGSHYKTVLFETCARDDLAWATRKLISHPLCIVNIGPWFNTPLSRAISFDNPDQNIENVKILLTRADLEITAIDENGRDLGDYIKHMKESKVKNLLLTAYPFLDEQK